jgi:tetratricopeptide (TPR) repeat protein
VTSKLQQFKYKAFISYSHKDRIWSEWLHKKLEAYRLPKSLRLKRLEAGFDDGKLHPIFRDREELPAHENMTDKILEAIKVSEFLIVICSPHSVKSRMVNEEIREFRRQNGNKNILCLIASGDPGVFNSHSLNEANNLAVPPEGACFPPALFETNAIDDNLPDVPSNPLAADVRPGGDGKRNAYLKIAAGILGINLSELVRRDFVKRQRQITTALIMSISVSAIMGWLTWVTIQESKRAEKRQMETDQFADYFAEILYSELPKTGREDLIQGVIDRLLKYYDNLDDKSPDHLYRKALAYNRIAHILDTYDQYEDYVALQLKAIKIIDLLIRDDLENIDYLYLKARAYGSMALAITWKGRPEEAIEYGLIEKEVLHQLLKNDPDNTELHDSLGVSYTVSGLSYFENLANIEAAERDYRKALEIRKKATLLPQKTPWSNNYLGAAYINMARVYSVKGPIGDMQKYANLSIDAFKENYDNDQTNQNARFVLARGIRDLAHAEKFSGNINLALQKYQLSYQSFQSLLASRPNNSLWEHTINLVVVAFAETLISNKQYAAAGELLEKYNDSIVTYYNGNDVKNYHVSTFYFARYIEALLALEAGDLETAKNKLLFILSNYEKDEKASFHTVTSIIDAYCSSYLLYGKILKSERRESEARKVWQEAIYLFGEKLQSKRMDIRATIAQIYIELGKYDLAKKNIDALHKLGYSEVGYVRAIDAAISNDFITVPKGWEKAPDYVDFDLKLMS